MTRMLTLLLSALLALVLADSPGALAAVLHVSADGTGQYPTIQAAIDAAAAGDTVSLADGTYRGDGNRDIEYHGKAITVESQSGEPALCIIDCQGSASEPHRGFDFHGGEPSAALLRGITIMNGYAVDSGGGIICHADQSCSPSSPTIEHCVVTRCFAPVGAGIGAGLYDWEAPCAFSDASCPTLSSCSIHHNTGHGASFWYYTSPSRPVSVSDCSFSSNSGCGLFTDGYIWETTTLINCIADSNGQHGLCLYQEFGLTRVIGGHASYNESDGVYIRSTEALVAQVLDFHSLYNHGNGIRLYEYVRYTVQNCVMAGNSINGIAASTYSSTGSRVAGCDLIGNSSYGIASIWPSTIDSCLVCNNELGGVQWLYDDSNIATAGVMHTTIVDNGGDGIVVQGASMSLEIHATIVAFNCIPSAEVRHNQA